MTVQELMNLLLTRLPGPALCSIFEAVREVQAIIANRLLLRRSDLLRKETDGELVFAVGEGRKTLPADFRQLAGRPTPKGTSPLAPLPSSDTSDLQDLGEAKYYRVTGRTLEIFPPVEVETTICVPYYFAPAVLTALDGALPFFGEFDSVFVEGCTAVMTQGLSAVADRAFVGVIQSQVDAVLEAKDLADEQLMADAINGL